MNGRRLDVPPAAAKLLVVLVAVQALRAVLPHEQDLHLLAWLGFHPFRSGGFEPLLLYGAVTSIFVHAGWWHLAANGFWLLALSPRIADRLGASRFVVLFVAAGACGALAHAALNWSAGGLLVGASGGVFGLLGAGAHVPARGGGRPSLRDVVVYVLVMMLLVNLAYAAVGGPGISWEAHAGGFFAGLVLFPLLRRPPPGPWTRRAPPPERP